MEALPLWMPLVFFAIAVAYSMAGFGGGSAYLAALALAGISFVAIPQTALACNLVVSAGGVWHFARGGHVDVRRIAPFFVLSVPLAYVGGTVPIERDAFTVLLALSLLAAGARMFIHVSASAPRAVDARRAWLVGLPVGAVLGLLSGIVGIGGGVFLAPVLLLSRWADAKQTAAAASLFVFLNSAAGLAGQASKGIHIDATIVPLLIAVVLGGQIGSRAGAYRMPLKGVQRVLAAIVVAVSLRLLWSVL